MDLERLDLVYAVLETTSVLSRTYEKAGGAGVDLLVTYFERGHRGFHPPEVSFVASGNTIVRAARVHIPLADGDGARRLEANMFLGKTPRGQVLFIYWFGVGDRQMASYLKASALQFWSSIQQRPGRASMVRLALPVPAGGLERARAAATDFIRHLVPMLSELLAEPPPGRGAAPWQTAELVTARRVSPCSRPRRRTGAGPSRSYGLLLRVRTGPSGKSRPALISPAACPRPALFTNGDGATGRVAQGAVPAGPRAVGPPRPVRRAQRGVRASG